VVITFWLGHEGVQTGAQVGYPSRPGPAQSSTWRPIFSETQSREGSADAHRHARIKCGVGSPAIRSQSLFPQFTPHFTVLDIWKEMPSSAFLSMSSRSTFWPRRS
jgi:hypothetical protein